MSDISFINIQDSYLLSFYLWINLRSIDGFHRAPGWALSWTWPLPDLDLGLSLTIFNSLLSICKSIWVFILLYSVIQISPFSPLYSGLSVCLGAGVTAVISSSLSSHHGWDHGVSQVRDKIEYVATSYLRLNQRRYNKDPTTKPGTLTTYTSSTSHPDPRCKI